MLALLAASVVEYSVDLLRVRAKVLHSLSIVGRSNVKIRTKLCSLPNTDRPTLLPLLREVHKLSSVLRTLRRTMRSFSEHMGTDPEQEESASRKACGGGSEADKGRQQPSEEHSTRILKSQMTRNGLECHRAQESSTCSLTSHTAGCCAHCPVLLPSSAARIPPLINSGKAFGKILSPWSMSAFREATFDTIPFTSSEFLFHLQFLECIKTRILLKHNAM